MTEMKIARTAIAWFRRSDWPEWHRTCDDMQADYDEWEKSAKSGLERYRASGHIVEPTIIRPRPFLDWCRQEGREPNGSARAGYAVVVMGPPPT